MLSVFSETIIFTKYNCRLGLYGRGESVIVFGKLVSLRMSVQEVDANKANSVLSISLHCKAQWATEIIITLRKIINSLFNSDYRS